MPSLKCYLFEPVRGALTPSSARLVKPVQPEEHRHEDAAHRPSHDHAFGHRPGLSDPCVRAGPGAGPAAVPRTGPSDRIDADAASGNRTVASGAHQAETGRAAAGGTHFVERAATRWP